MPIYFFNLHNDVEAVDNEGMDFPDASAALIFAVQSVRNLIAFSIESEGSFSVHHSLDVLNADGVLIEKINFGSVVKVLP